MLGRARAQVQIAESVIVLVGVDVMHALAALEMASKMSFHDIDVFGDRPGPPIVGDEISVPVALAERPPPPLARLPESDLERPGAGLGESSLKVSSSVAQRALAVGSAKVLILFRSPSAQRASDSELPPELPDEASVNSKTSRDNSMRHCVIVSAESGEFVVTKDSTWRHKMNTLLRRCGTPKCCASRISASHR